ncbi:MAG TPA: OsmC family protein [Candidatus Acidoferrum sp.]
MAATVVTVEHLGGVQFEVKARQHRLVCDQPAENGGFDEGMTPPELLLASLGTCAGFYAAQYWKKHRLAAEGSVVRVSAEKATNPPRLNDFQIQIEIPPGISDQHSAGIEAAVRHCLIHNTLVNPPSISLEIKRTVFQVG